MWYLLFNLQAEIALALAFLLRKNNSFQNEKKKKKKAKIQDSMISLLYVCFTHIMMAASEEIPTVLL